MTPLGEIRLDAPDERPDPGRRFKPRSAARRNGKVGLLRPLRHPDFGLLWGGVTISLLGDGIYLVALPFLVLSLSNAATALSLVGLSLTLPQIVFPLIGGVITDRLDRRRILIGADLLRLAAVASIGLLALAEALTLPVILGFTVLYGIGESFFMPAFQAIIPQVVPDEKLLEANSLNQFSRPLMYRLLGPAIGGVLVALIDPGGAVLVDAATFGVSALAVLAVRARPSFGRGRGSNPSMISEMREGFRFVRSQPWLWASLLAAALGLLAFWGPYEVLLPYIVKNRLGQGAGSFGLIVAAGGVGAILAASLIGQSGLPRRPLSFTYGCWAGGTAVMVILAWAVSEWQLMIAVFVMFGLFTAGQIVWSTLMHKLVPAHLLGRVSALDWMLSSALLPVSFAITGPLADAVGPRPTIIGAALLGAIAVLAFLAVPGVRATERDGHLAPARPGISSAD